MKTKRLILKNKFFFTAFILVALLIFSGCEKDLAPRPYSALTPENFPKNETELNTAVTGVYNSFKKQNVSRNWSTPYVYSQGSMQLVGEVTTDEFFVNWGWEVLINFGFRPETEEIAQFWFSAMPAITNATMTIEMVKAATYISEEKRNQLIAQLKCIRSIYAFDLYDMHGPIPIMTDPEVVMNIAVAQDYNPSRPTKEEYVSALETELLEISDILPLSYDAGNFGRMTKGTAMTALLKLYMHEKQWQKAADIAKRIMDLNYYQLQPKFTDIWSPSNEQNKEIIWGIAFIPGDAYGNWYLPSVLPGDFKGLAPGGSDINYLSWNGFRMPWRVWDSFDPDDQRRIPFVRHYWDGTKMVDGRSQWHMDENKGSLPMKMSIDPAVPGSITGTDYVVYRYADVLLYRAEALNELQGPNAETFSIINTIRSRAGLDPIASTGLDKSALRTRILQERQWELCFEGTRRQDLIRNGTFISNAHSRGKSAAKDFHVLFPIPQEVINENPNVQQNPGY